MTDLEVINQLKKYLNSEMSEGKTEFRLVVRKEDSETVVYMHPLDKNGDTLDLRWEG